MAGADGFASGMQGGMQLGLSMFNAMQNASYQQQLMQNAEDNKQMRHTDLQLKQQQFIVEQRQKDVLHDEFVLSHPEAFPQETRLQVVNRSNARLAGPNARPISALAIDTFEADLRGLPGRLKSTNTREGALSIMSEMEAKAHENPLFKQAWDVRKPVFNQIIEQGGLYDTARETFGELMDEKETRRWVEKTDPSIIRKTLEDKDYQKMFVMRHVEENLSAWHAGERQFSDSAIRQNLAMGRAVGMTLGPTGEKILKEHDTYTTYNESAESLKMAKGRLDPLYKAVASSPDAKELKDAKVEMNADYFAHPTPDSPFGSLRYVAKDVAAAEKRTADFESFMGKNPQIAETVRQLAPEAMDRTRQATEQLEDLKRQRTLLEKDKLHPNRNMYLNVIDRQVESLKREVGAWKPLAEYQQSPNIVTLQKVLRSEDTLNRSLKEVNTLRDEALTASDRVAKKEVELKQTTVAETRATGYAQMKLNEFAAQNPNADESVLRGKSAEFANEAKSTFGQLPDSNKVLDSFITKRTQSTILTGEERKTVAEAEANVVVADSLIENFKPEYFGSADNFMNSLRAKLPEGSPQFMQLSAEAQEYRQRVELFRTQYRKRIFGSSLTEGEKESALNSMINLDMGDSQAKATLQEMKKWEQKAIESTKRNAQKSEQVKQGVDPYQQKGAPVFDDFKSFYQKNKGKFASPEEAAAAFFKGQ